MIDMAPAEFSSILSRLDLTQVGAAKLLGVEDRTVRRWIAGAIPVPELVARVMRAADVGKIKLSDLFERPAWRD